MSVIKPPINHTQAAVMHSGDHALSLHVLKMYIIYVKTRPYVGVKMMVTALMLTLMVILMTEKS